MVGSWAVCMRRKEYALSLPYMTMGDRRAHAALGGKVACCARGHEQDFRAMSRARGCPMSPTRFILFWARKLVSSRLPAVHLPTQAFPTIP